MKFATIKSVLGKGIVHALDPSVSGPAREIINSGKDSSFYLAFGYDPNDVVSLLKKYGYRCFISNSFGLKEIKNIDNKTIETNFFFLHGSKHEKQISVLSTKRS